MSTLAAPVSVQSVSKYASTFTYNEKSTKLETALLGRERAFKWDWAASKTTGGGSGGGEGCEGGRG